MTYGLMLSFYINTIRSGSVSTFAAIEHSSPALVFQHPFLSPALEHSGAGLSLFIPVSNWFRHQHLFSFRYRTDWMPDSPAFRYYNNLYKERQLRFGLHSSSEMQRQLSRVQRSPEGAQQLRRVQRSSVGCNVAQQEAAQISRVQRRSSGASVARKDAEQLSRVQRSSVGCSLAQQVQRSSVGCSVAQRMQRNSEWCCEAQQDDLLSTLESSVAQEGAVELRRDQQRSVGGSVDQLFVRWLAVRQTWALSLSLRIILLQLLFTFNQNNIF